MAKDRGDATRRPGRSPTRAPAVPRVPPRGGGPARPRRAGRELGPPPPRRGRVARRRSCAVLLVGAARGYRALDQRSSWSRRPSGTSRSQPPKSSRPMQGSRRPRAAASAPEGPARDEARVRVVAFEETRGVKKVREGVGRRGPRLHGRPSRSPRPGHLPFGAARRGDRGGRDGAPDPRRRARRREPLREASARNLPGWTASDVEWLRARRQEALALAPVPGVGRRERAVIAPYVPPGRPPLRPDPALFLASFTGMDMAEPLVSFDEEASEPAVRSRAPGRRGLEPHGVRDDGVVTGYAAGRSSSTGAAASTPARSRRTTSSRRRLAPRTIDSLDVNGRCFVSILDRPWGIVTLRELEKPPVRMWLFGMMTMVERDLAGRSA